MRRSASELRARHRRVLLWSFGVAAAAHAAVFLLSPVFTAEPLATDGRESEERPGWPEMPTFIQVVFGPPTITTADGGSWTEPDDRVLEAEQVTDLPLACRSPDRRKPLPLSGGIRLRVAASGHAQALGIAESTGDACGDEVLTVMADALRYHWLPSDEFPPPVDLVQPVTLTGVRD